MAIGPAGTFAKTYPVVCRVYEIGFGDVDLVCTCTIPGGVRPDSGARTAERSS